MDLCINFIVCSIFNSSVSILYWFFSFNLPSLGLFCYFSIFLSWVPKFIYFYLISIVQILKAKMFSEHYFNTYHMLLYIVIFIA